MDKLNERIIEALRKNDRKYFVPPALQDQANIDAPLPIGAGQTISQPSTVAFMMELLDPKLGQKILDVGFGSGWTTATPPGPTVSSSSAPTSTAR